MIKIPRTKLNNPDDALSREWLVANGIGGYASSTVVGANTRRYHGLLVASIPPLERQVLLAKVDEELIIGPKTYLLGVNEYQDGTIHPQGYRFLKSFKLDLGIPTFEYHVGGVKLIKRVWMEQGENTVYVSYHLLESPSDITLKVRPFCAFRGYHNDGQRGGMEYSIRREERCVAVGTGYAPYLLKMGMSSQCEFAQSADWHWNFFYRAERDRGLGCTEDLFTPGEFVVSLSSGERIGFIATCEEAADFAGAFERELARRIALAGAEHDSLRRELLLSADQFVMQSSVISRQLSVKAALTPALSHKWARESSDDARRTTHDAILAGYHWFTDWGRDTMISLPGLLLSTGRFAEARDILIRYSEYIYEGMLPNRIADDGVIEYNTVDATLWYFHALDSYVKASGDREIIYSVFPRLKEIIDWHIKGMRFGIRVDPSDGLLFSGQEGSQLTWMDARSNGIPVTPRIGKPVEINALWFNALSLMSAWERRTPNIYKQMAENCAESFRQKFWYEKGGYLYDVIDGPDGNDTSLRPNQIIAVSLPYSSLDVEQKKAVVDTVEKALLTPYGLRTLSQDDSAYIGRYRGGPAERDGAYHQGAVWPWLLGHFADAHYRVYSDKKYIASLLKPFRDHLTEAGIGSISELFDGDYPHTPGGCIAQAWSIAEILRICTSYA